MLLTSRQRYPCYICLNQILDFGKVHLDLRVSKKVMSNEHQMAFQIFIFTVKFFMFLGGHDGPIFRRAAFRKI